MEEQRVVRVPLPVQLIRRMDALLLERKGGFESRAEFIKEAVEAMVTEVQFGAAEGENPSLSAPFTEPEQPQSETPPEPFELSSPATLDFTELRAPSVDVELIESGEATAVDDSLFGLHNRDYPSIWAAFKLWAHGRPLRFDHYRKLLVDDAWVFADRLGSIEREMNVKVSALFPKNKDKPQASADSFFTFAVGSFTETLEGFRGVGPLFQWRVCQLRRGTDGVEIGLTTEGLELLRSLEGLSLRLPHHEAAARLFLGHLRADAPKDWWGFDLVLRRCFEPATRADLVSAFGSERPEWKENVVATNVAGYVARAREWGLVNNKQVQGRYTLTPLGRTHVEGEGN
ncbi:MAG TPA: ribbon-helix-helix domain-containing protein [Actinomycetota bacterium]|nr:ribbon-helix-helix domain-containing protein [Actinomycetota bacterium]